MSLRSRGAVAKIRSSFEILGKQLVLDWRLALVASITARGDRTTITALFFGEPVPASLGFANKIHGIEHGDAVAVRGKRISFFDRTAGEQRILPIGGRAALLSQQSHDQDVALASVFARGHGNE